jgi:hypothetical protein
VPVATMGGDVGTLTFNLDEYWDSNYHGRFDQHRAHWQDYYHHRDQN